ncbi:transcriptional antitermination N peptide [Pantoea agglomerans]
MACNQRVEKAVISPSLRDQKTTGSACLPEVAIYAAGHRKPTKSIYPAR